MTVFNVELDESQQIDVYSYLLGATDGPAFEKVLASYPFLTQRTMVQFLRAVASDSRRQLTDEQKCLVRQYWTFPLVETPLLDDEC